MDKWRWDVWILVCFAGVNLLGVAYNASVGNSWLAAFSGFACGWCGMAAFFAWGHKP